RVHQYGLKDRPNPRAKDVQYAERQLLGFSREHEQFVEMLVIGYLKKFH
ncbi:phage virion morphogenesis protein, partial [Enterobacter hormaechei]